MYIKEKSAQDFVCCRDLKNSCLGAKCMAWVWRENYDDINEEPTIGHCGLVPFHGLDHNTTYLVECLENALEKITGKKSF